MQTKVFLAYCDASDVREIQKLITVYRARQRQAQGVDSRDPCHSRGSRKGEARVIYVATDHFHQSHSRPCYSIFFNLVQ